MFNNPKCTIADKCPWGVKPKIGMWCKELNLYATDCLLYTDCPRTSWPKSKTQEIN